MNINVTPIENDILYWSFLIVNHSQVLFTVVSHINNSLGPAPSSNIISRLVISEFLSFDDLNG